MIVIYARISYQILLFFCEMFAAATAAVAVFVLTASVDAESFGIDVAAPVDADQWRCAVDAGLDWQITRAWHR